MRKIVFLFAVALLAVSATQAQLKPNVDKSNVKRPTSTPPPPAPAPPPAPVNKTTPPENTPTLVYDLTSVRVRIKTGRDNKEFPSKVFTYLRTKSSPAGDYNPFFQVKLDNEMQSYTDTEFGMERTSGLRGESKLAAFQSSGLKFEVRYYPNFFADAWRIEKITLTLEFKDQFGNPHPTLGSKTIIFGNAVGFLDATYWIMECETDGSFAPLTAIIKK